MTPAKINAKIYQGITFNQVLRLESPLKTYKSISNITKTAPIVLTALEHNIPEGWRFRVTNVAGMKEINSTSGIYYYASNTTTDAITINAINAVDFTAYTSGGIVEYNTPMDFNGYTARMHVRIKLEDVMPLLVLTTENGGIIIDTVLKTITITISAAATAALTFSAAVYSLELVSGTGIVSSPITGSLTLVKEVTR